MRETSEMALGDYERRRENELQEVCLCRGLLPPLMAISLCSCEAAGEARQSAPLTPSSPTVAAGEKCVNRYGPIIIVTHLAFLWSAGA